MRCRNIVGTVCLAFALPVVAQAQGHAAHYVLDAFGGVHAAGGAPVISPPTPYFGFDAAADIEYIPVGNGVVTGDGILVLDKFGGVHKGGALAAAPPSGATPYFGFDAARAIVYRDVPARAAGVSVNTAVGVSSSSFVVLAGVGIAAPDDGFLMVTATTNAYCFGTGAVRAELALDVDGAGTLNQYYFDVPDCDAGIAEVDEVIAITKLFQVSAGNHIAYLRGRRISGNTVAQFDSLSVTALFIDQNGFGASVPVQSAGNDAARPDDRVGERR